MNTQTRFYPFTAWLFVLVACLIFPGSFLQAQEIPAPGPTPPGQNAPPAQALRRTLERSELSVENILRLLELPAAREALVLNDEQRKRIEDISFNVRKATIQQQAALRVQRLEMEHMMRADMPDRGAIDRKVQEVGQTQADIMRMKINALMDLRSVLTKEQKDKIEKLLLRRIQQAVRTRVQQTQPVLKLAPSVPAVPQAQPKQPLSR